MFAFPAPPQQQQLWFLDQFDPGNPAYNIPLAYELRGGLDADALDQSLQWVVDRHETFRTALAIREQELFQIVRSELPIGFERIDLRNLPASEKTAACDKAVSDAVGHRFNLATGPLVQGKLLLLESAKHVVVFNFHHAILDHLSVLQFAREFCQAYGCFKKRRAPDLDAPSLQYADFAVWQEEQIQDPAFQSELKDWITGFDSASPSSIFPTDKKRPATQIFAGREVKFVLSPKLGSGIRELARGSKKSVYVTLLTLFQCLLARYSGQDDVVVGSPFSNRMIADLEGVMGCCMNTLPLRAQLGEAGTFREAMDIVHRSVLAAYSRQRVPLKLIVDALRPDRSAGINPLFQSTFTFQDPPMSIELEGLEGTSLCVHNGTSKFDMAVWMWDSEGQISGLWEYNTSLYEAETINRLIRNFQTLAAGAVAAPETPWRRLPLLAPEEANLILHDFNRAERIWPDHCSLVGLVESAAAGCLEEVAIVTDEVELTYGELLQRVDALSRRLVALDVGSESLVGVFLERSPEMVIALLAILKSGGAYLPLDPEFPEDRLAFMIEDSALAFIISDSKVAGRLPSHRAKAILLDEVQTSPTVGGKAANQPAMESLEGLDSDRASPVLIA